MDFNQNDNIIIVPESMYTDIVRDLYSLQMENDFLHDELVKYTSPCASSDLEYMKGIHVYLIDTLSEYTSIQNIEILYKNVCVYADDYPSPFDARKYSPVWVSPVLRGYDICRMFWGINKAVGASGSYAGMFLKTVFPTMFARSQASSLGSNLTKYDGNMSLKNVIFGSMSPREYFKGLYNEHQK